MATQKLVTSLSIRNHGYFIVLCPDYSRNTRTVENTNPGSDLFVYSDGRDSSRVENDILNRSACDSAVFSAVLLRRTPTDKTDKTSPGSQREVTRGLM